MIALCPDGVDPGYLERQIFIEQLPGMVQQDMAAHEEETDFVKLAKIADRYVIAARAREASMSCAVTVPQSSSDTRSQSQPTSVVVGDSASGQDFSPCNAVGGRGQVPTARKLCFYHQRFGVSTHRCGGNGCMWRKPWGKGNASRH